MTHKSTKCMPKLIKY